MTSANKTLSANKTFRFDFSPSIVKLIDEFAFTHQWSNKKTYYSNWHDSWLLKNENEIQKEIDRITNEGYVGDIKDKMYKAGRYYFRKKHIKNHNKNKLSEATSTEAATAEAAIAEAATAEAASTEEVVVQHNLNNINIADADDDNINNTDMDDDDNNNNNNNKAAVDIVNKKRTYITIQKELLKIMDTHIINGLQDKLNVFKPEHGFEDFNNKHITSIRAEIQRLLTNYKFEPTQTIHKLKKTYKNRYYIVTRK
jgi:hypothetical protein